MNLPAARPHDQAVLEHLIAAHPDGGYAQMPAAMPRWALWPIAATLDGEGVSVARDGTLAYQITAVGQGPEQARWLRDLLHDRMLQRPHPTVPGRDVVWVEHDSGGALMRDDDTGGAPLWYATDRYSLTTAPTQE